MASQASPSPHAPADIHLRSYGDESPAHRHDFPQLVLPLSGRLELDVAGRQGVADASTGVFVEPGADHATSAAGANRSLVLDLAPAMASAALLEQLAARPFMPLSQAAGKLVDFMALMLEQQQKMALAQLQHWVPLLLDTLAMAAPRPQSRLHLLMAKMEAQPALPWSVPDMAVAAAISPSRLHEWFQRETGATPRAWLAELRVKQACELLRGSALPLSEIALRCGYADQSALSNAMRKLRATTPAAYRRALPAGRD
ncbi:AraC family transcriptional regulator [Herbaspirillum sp. WKF16]|uniref:helix-turn-helix transcriptional regulator n=1 Tax=Herbaspirillum sp. WKF16 TaxID=3028312 RepID=UPI0023A94728|nr:AraC family transcriptional regulator [Herbaspirillum sp. WKF16]WDZ97192.1 AraC family transcriptional regulator [Herbaspirillum sp. WKF16]